MTTPDFSSRFAQILRALLATTLHALVWGVSIYVIATQWERPYIDWAQKNGFGLSMFLSQSLKCWDLGFKHPYLSMSCFGVLVAADFCVFMQFDHTPKSKLLRDFWFATILSVPLLLAPLLGVMQTKYFLEQQIDPYSILLASPEIEAEVNLLNGLWRSSSSDSSTQNAAEADIDQDRIEFSNGTFQWESHEKGIARGMVYFESLRTPKQIQFVAMDPTATWTIRAGIYRLNENELVIMVPKWDSLNLPPPLDFEWDDDRYETLVLVRESHK